MKPLALTFFTLLAAVGAAAQEVPCQTADDCLAEQACLLPVCPACDPAADPDCDAACGTGVCIDIAPLPAETPCTVDDDCGPGQLCAIRDCAPPCDLNDPDCVPTDCSGGGTCIDRQGPPTCTSDADCANGDVCITETYETCVGTGCACPDDGDGDPSNDPPCDCGEPVPPECTSETFSFCGPRYLAACAVDADCGPGFTCEFHDGCDCPVDSSGTPACDCPTDPGAQPPGACALERVECADDTDCANGFVCVDEATTQPCIVDESGNTSCDGSAATKVCAPPGYETGGLPVSEAPRNDDVATEAEEDADVPATSEADDIVLLSCTQGSASGALPLAALALLLRRRRR